MKTSRRNFLKMAGTAAVALFVPKSIKVEAAEDIGEITLVIAGDDGPEATTFELNGNQVVEGDNELLERYRAALDSCECHFDVQVNYGQCKPCSRCGGTGWLYDDIGWSYPCPECRQENPLSTSIIVPASAVEFAPEAEWETLYAMDLGKATLTQSEKRQAWLNHVSEEYPGWCRSLGIDDSIVNTGYIDNISSVSCPPMGDDPFWTIQHYITEKLGNARFVSARIEDVERIQKT